MRIAVHAKVLSEKNLHGIGYYVLHLLEELLKIDSGNEYCLISDAPLLHPPSGSRWSNLLARPNFLMSYIGFPRTFRKGAFDLAFVPKEVVPPFLGKPVVLTVHDLFFSRKYAQINGQGLSISSFQNSLAIAHHLKSADRILAVSEATKNDILELCSISPEHVRVTPLGVDTAFFRPVENASALVKKKFGIDRPYFLNVASLWWARKNLLRLIEAYALLLDRGLRETDLVITGSRGPLFGAMTRLIAEKNLHSRVHLLEYVSRDDLPFLYSGAMGFVFPSLHEGFGIPVLESMACGTPVITSNVSSLPEVAGPASLLVDPYDTASIVDAMEELLSNAPMRRVLSEKGIERSKEFSWERTAKLTLKAFEEKNPGKWK